MLRRRQWQPNMAFYRFLECKKLRRKCSHAIDDRCVERMLLLCDSLQLDLQLGMGLLQKLLHLHQRLRLRRAQLPRGRVGRAGKRARRVGRCWWISRPTGV